MKRSDTLFRHKATLLYETGASIREMVYAITHKSNSSEIDFRVFKELGVCDRVGTWINAEGKEGYWGLFTRVQRNAGNQDIYFRAEGGGNVREEEMYDYSLDELIYLHDEIEKIYKYIVKGEPLAR